jgi:hypothetical protein
LFKRGELFRIEIEFLGVSRESACDFRKLDHSSGVHRREFCDRAVDLFQFSKQPLRFRELGENGIVCLGKSVRDPAGKLNQPFAVAGKFVALLDFFFFARNEIRRFDLGDLVPKQIQFLLARGFHRVERGMFGKQCLQLPIKRSIFLELFLSARERIKQAQLRLWREQRLVIVRTMKINKFFPEIFQHRQCRWRPIDELPISPGRGESPLQDQIVFAWLNARFGKLRIELLQFRAGKDRFDGTKISTSPNQRFVRALTQQKLQRADDD